MVGEKRNFNTTNDTLHPTVDRDNIYQKFGFGIR